MNAKIIYLGQRSITLELQNDLPYYNDSLYDIYLNGELYQEKGQVNVISIYDLLPQTKYIVEIRTQEESASVEFETKSEYVTLDVKRFGAKGDGVTDAWDVVDVTINQLYLELPLMVGARIHTASNFDLLFKGGPYLAYGVGGKTKIDGVSEKADTFGDDGLKRFDAGLGLGVAFEFGKIVVGVETGTSFTKVASGVSAHNLSALATIGYKF